MNDPQNATPISASDRAASDLARWQRPDFEVIDLACELSAYAPDGGGPLF
jgi:hypothetical protein